jgi:hypothetical protein
MCTFSEEGDLSNILFRKLLISWERGSGVTVLYRPQPASLIGYALLKIFVCLRQPGLKKTKNIRSLSPPSAAPRRIGADYIHVCYVAATPA